MITYLHYNGILKNKQEYDLDEIKRAVVTYRLQVTVTQRTGFIISDGAQLLVPKVITITRKKEEKKEEKSRNQRKSIKEKAMEHLNNDLESYKEAVMGIFVMNKTGLPQGECERLKSIANIESAHLYQSRLGLFSTLKYEKENMSVAVTLNENTTNCHRRLF